MQTLGAKQMGRLRCKNMIILSSFNAENNDFLGEKNIKMMLKSPRSHLQVELPLDKEFKKKKFALVTKPEIQKLKQ